MSHSPKVTLSYSNHSKKVPIFNAIFIHAIALCVALRQMSVITAAIKWLMARGRGNAFKMTAGCMVDVLSGVNLWVRVWLCAAQTETGNTRGGATKKREISCTLLSINLHFSIHETRNVAQPCTLH